jgi:hypothetical protein
VSHRFRELARSLIDGFKIESPFEALADFLSNAVTGSVACCFQLAPQIIGKRDAHLSL